MNSEAKSDPNELAYLAEVALSDDNWPDFQNVFSAGKVNFRHNIVMLSLYKAQVNLSHIGYLNLVLTYWDEQFKQSYPQHYEDALALQKQDRVEQEAKQLNHSTPFLTQRHLKTRL
jgi:hypothetical protein